MAKNRLSDMIEGELNKQIKKSKSRNSQWVLWIFFILMILSLAAAYLHYKGQINLLGQ